MDKIKINVLSQGRFHMLDLSRELVKQGFDVKFYSYVPPKRCEKFGLKKQNFKSLFLYMLPFLAIEHYLHIDIVKLAQDLLMRFFMRKCDVVISLTGFILAPRKARHQSSIIIFERGSKHIIEQKKILEKNPAVFNNIVIPIKNIRLNLKAYEMADYIAIASKHVEQSFLVHNYPKDKLFINPYGVDLSMFKPLANIEKKYDFIMVGGWSYRKGCDLIVKAIRYTNYSFLHVGSIVDVKMPNEKQITHIDPVDQTELISYYNQSKVFVLPSREEGLAMVQAQAIACNLPIICSKDSGAEDLKEMVEYPQYITIIEDYTVKSLLTAMEEAMQNYKTLQGKIYAGNAINNLTWEAYGKRYADFLHKITQK